MIITPPPHPSRTVSPTYTRSTPSENGFLLVCAYRDLKGHCSFVIHRLSTPAAEQQDEPLGSIPLHAPASRVEEAVSHHSTRSTSESKQESNGCKTSGDRLQTSQVNRFMSRS
ncbi:unnamed protein product [Ectocarpus sp. 4 AP-2014]